MINPLLAEVLANQFTADTANQFGAIKGAPCQVSSITSGDGKHTVTLTWTNDEGETQSQSFDVMDGGQISDEDIERCLNEYLEDNPINSYTKTESDAKYATKAEVPSKVSDLTNDSGYLTQHQSLEDYSTTSQMNQAISDATANIPSVPTNVSAFTNDAGYLTEHQSLNNYVQKEEGKGLFSGSYNDLQNKPTIPIVPTNVSAFTNDAGYLTQHQSLNNYVQKEPGKNLFSGSYEDLTNKPTIPTVPTKVSAFANDAGYLNQHQSLEDYSTTNQMNNAINEATTDMATNSSVNTTLEDYSTTAEVLAKIAEEIAKIVADAPNSFDTLKEIADWIATHSDSASQMNSDIQANATAITNLQTGKVDKETGKGLFSGSYDDLTNRPTIPIVPTKVSAFTNDSGYLTQHQSLSNYVQKEAGKGLFSGYYNDLNGKPTIPTVPTNISAFTNDAGYKTTDTTYSEATTSSTGLMSSSDKQKVNKCIYKANGTSLKWSDICS